MASSFKSEFMVSGLSGALVLINSSLGFNQFVDRRSRANSGVRMGQLRITVVGSDEGVLANWAADPKSAKSGWMVYKDATGGTMQRIEFKDAYCVSYQEVFQVSGQDASYVIHMGVTAREVTVDGYVHDNMWLDWEMSS